MDDAKPADGRLLYLVENLASLHGAPDMAWLAGRFEFLGEHAMGASLTSLLLPDESGAYRPTRTNAPRPALAATLWDELGLDGISSSAEAATVFTAAEASTKATRHELSALAGERADGHDAHVVLAPITFNRESIGLGLFLVQEPDDMTDAIANVLASHAAVAVYQLREREDARRLHSVDPKLWVPDEDFLRAQLQREVTRARRYGRELGIALLRLENERDVRARFGAFYADHMLRRIGSQLLAGLRDTDILGALDGAYAIIHTETGPEGTNISAYRLRDSIVKMVTQRFPEAPAPDISVCVASYPAHGSTVEALGRHLQDAVTDNTATSGETAVA